MTERSKKLSRQFRRYLGIENAEQGISDAIEYLEKTLPADKRQHLDLLKKISTLFDAVDQSYGEYEDRLKIATRNIEISSKELTEAFRNVERLNASINAILESLGQAFVFFDDQGICSDVYSQACLDLLGGDPSHKKVSDILDFDTEERTTFETWLNIAFHGDTALDFNDLKKLLPCSLSQKQNKHISLDYRPMFTGNHKLVYVLLIATDISAQVETEKKISKIKEESEKTLLIARNRNDFHNLIINIKAFIESAAHTKKDHDDIKILQDLHTFKGICSMFGLLDIASKIHKIEGKIKNNPQAYFDSDFVNDLKEIEDGINAETVFATSIFGNDFLRMGTARLIESDKLENLAKMIDRDIPSGEEKKSILKYMREHIQSVPIFSLFGPFKDELIRVARQLGKDEPEIQFLGDNPGIIPSEYEDVFATFIHIARNIMDHGIETPEDRIRWGKSGRGTIKIIVTEDREKGRIDINIQDDGRGVNMETLRERYTGDQTAISDHDLAQKIFDMDFTTKISATTISGRGIGLNAARSAILKKGGTIHVVTSHADSAGCTFKISLPITNH